jgi:hypothetical protein
MKRASVFVVLVGSMLVFTPDLTAQEEDPPAPPAAAASQPAAQPTPHVYPYPTGSHPPVFVTEIYRHKGHSQHRRQLNVFVYGMKPDIWQILHCYKPCCCSTNGICCQKHRQPVAPPVIDTPLPPTPAGVDPVAPPAPVDPFSEDAG